MKNADAVVVAVAHDEFKTISWEDIKTCEADQQSRFCVGRRKQYEGLIDCKDNFLLIDVKGIFDRKEAEEAGCLY